MSKPTHIINTELFIGGSADGQRIKTDNTDIMHIPVLGKLSKELDADAPIDLSEHEKDVYVREKLAYDDMNGGRTIFTFYRWEHLPVVSAYCELFGGYQRYAPKP